MRKRAASRFSAPVRPVRQTVADAGDADRWIDCGLDVSSILIARPQSDVLLPELSVGSIAAKAAANPTLGGTPAHLREFALNADTDSPQFTAPTVSVKRWPVVPPRKAQSH
jgi:hypothetical protein